MEQEQHGADRARYGEELIVKLSRDLQLRFGRGFGRANLFQMRAFYLAYREILQMASGQSVPPALAKKVQTADAGQMHLYLNYAREHWMLEGENPPVGLVLCAEKDSAVARYALEGLPNKVLAAEYRTALPKERTLVLEIEKTLHKIEARGEVLLGCGRRK